MNPPNLQTHVSELTLEQSFAEELDAAEATRVQAHLAQCEVCRARSDSLQREHEAFLAAAPSFEAHAQLVSGLTKPPPSASAHTARASRRKPLALVSGFVALAAGVLLIYSKQLPPQPNIRSKGGDVQIGFFIKHAGRVSRGTHDALVHAGDVLRFTYSSPRDTYLAFFGGDEQQSTAYFPTRGEAARVRAGKEVPLDFGVELDASGSTETVYALFCSEPFAVEAARERIVSGRDPARSGCQVRTLRLQKATAP